MEATFKLFEIPVDLDLDLILFKFATDDTSFFRWQKMRLR